MLLAIATFTLTAAAAACSDRLVGAVTPRVTFASLCGNPLLDGLKAGLLGG